MGKYDKIGKGGSSHFGYALIALGVLALLALAITTTVYSVDTFKKVSDNARNAAATCAPVAIETYNFERAGLVSALTDPPVGLNFYTNGNFTSNNGNLTQKVGYVQLLSAPYTSTVAQSTIGYLDHIKYVANANKTFELSLTHETVCSLSTSVQISGLSGQPFPAIQVQDADADLRLASAGLKTFDNVTYIGAGFQVTNTKIYATYDRSPLGQATSDYAAFTFAVPVGTRTPSQYNVMAVAYNKAKQYIRWLLDGIEVFRVDSVGMLISRQYMLIDYGGQEAAAFPDSIQCGFGTFSLLDAYAPCVATRVNAAGGVQCTFNSTYVGLVQLQTPSVYINPRTGSGAATFWNGTDPQGARLFGQGANMNLRNFEVYSQSC
jgi:hypothetical protein